MYAVLIILLLALRVSGQPPYPCDQKEKRKWPYGTVELRVEWDGRDEYTIVSVIEYKGEIQHGFQMDYDSLWLKRDSFFVNGKRVGLALFWDTLGNVRGRENYRNGRMALGRSGGGMGARSWTYAR